MSGYHSLLPQSGHRCTTHRPAFVNLKLIYLFCHCMVLSISCHHSSFVQNDEQRFPRSTNFHFPCLKEYWTLQLRMYWTVDPLPTSNAPNRLLNDSLVGSLVKTLFIGTYIPLLLSQNISENGNKRHDKNNVPIKYLFTTWFKSKLGIASMQGTSSLQKGTLLFIYTCIQLSSSISQSSTS